MLIEAHVLVAERLHGDDTTVPVLAKIQTDIGRIWTYVRDDRPFRRPGPTRGDLPLFARPTWAKHPAQHLEGYAGLLQGDAYAGTMRSSIVGDRRGQ